MGLFFQNHNVQQCCLCGDSQKLTGEHKIKASALNDEFGKAVLYVGKHNHSAKCMKLAQSTQSKHLKFSVRLCEACNTARTQPADREFDNYNKLAREKLNLGMNPMQIFDDNQYSAGSDVYLNLFRYFAKLLCCHMAEVDAPIPKRLSNFAISRSNANCIWLSVKKDWTYEQFSAHLGEHQFASHGGLIVYGHKLSGNPSAFHSTLTIGPLQYVFFMRLVQAEKTELELLYPDFLEWCRSQVEQAKQFPLTEEEKKSLGLS